MEFADDQCPFSARSEPTLRALGERYGDRLRIVFRDLPIPGTHENAAGAAEAAGCAQEQGRFWEMHGALFASQGDLGRDGLRRRAREAGLSLEAFEACLASGRRREEWRDDAAEAARHGVAGTPAFFVNGRLLLGARPLEELVRVVEEELSRVR